MIKFASGRKYNTIYADPPWQFQNRTGKVAPEHKRLTRYETMTLDDIKALPVADLAGDKAHLYLWVPNALLPDGLAVMDAWGFEYKGNIVWEKVRKDNCTGLCSICIAEWCFAFAKIRSSCPYGSKCRRV